MPATNSRNRIVVFRLSQEEYDSLKAACEAAGGRNVSDFTRSELMATVQSGSIHAVIQRRFVELNSRLSELCDLLRSVSVRIDAAGAACPLSEREAVPE